KITVPVAIHLDHGSSFDSCKAAIDAGFSSVMIDGSHHPIDENIAMTKQVVDYAHAKGVSVEAEIGTVGGDEDGVTGGINYADPQECLRVVKEANIDALAAALGSVHGPYHGEPVLGFDEMKEISELTGAPLVLHGGSANPDAEIAAAVEIGIQKVNISSDYKYAFYKKCREILSTTELWDANAIYPDCIDAAKEVVKYKM
ncbi:ketose-bisphosphate aldolase, partial [Escherichia coli]|nr:ketose-bisphosphate aldolase [Escherichia coli]